MQEHFPEVQTASCEWVVAADEHGLRSSVLGALLEKYVPAGDLLVEVHRKVGDFLPMQAAMVFVAEHLGQGEIRVADREFTGFVVVAVNGVATGWSAKKLASPVSK
jgi:hypothetical protein